MDPEARVYETEMFIGDRCYYATHQPAILNAIREILQRLPQEILEILVYERDIRVFFPEAAANTVYRHDYVLPVNEKVRTQTTWFVQLGEYLNTSTHSKVIGVIVHEFAHVILEQTKRTPEVEAAADALATQWGFGEEIDASKAL